MNQITITGNIVKEPELRFTSTGTPICILRLASSQGKDKPSLFIDVDVWNEMAETTAELTKGNRIAVIGYLKMETWETDDGSQRSKFKITAQEIAVSTRWQSVSVERVEREPREEYDQDEG